MMRQVVHERGEVDLERWRASARRLVLASVRPECVEWIDPEDAQGVLCAIGEDARGVGQRQRVELDGREGERFGNAKAFRVPGAFLGLARVVLAHKSAAKWDWLYRALWRMTRGGERDLLSRPLDADVLALHAAAKSVKRDAHKMKAFVRFRRIADERGEEHFVAYHRSEHLVYRFVGPFFARRFGVMRWTIMTPFGSASWDGVELHFGPRAMGDRPRVEDELEAFWKTYYASVFNPARANPRAMTKEMPKKYWSTLPEAALIEDLLANAPTRTESMLGRTVAPEIGGAATFMPERLDDRAPVALQQLATAAKSCRGCEIYCKATQVVFGQGPIDARMMLVGEQPGDQEDRMGAPFIGPAGKLLDRALLDAGILREACYVTNAVKHFKWTPAVVGEMRRHTKPSVLEVRACRPWVEGEIALIKPVVLVLLGSTAGQSLLGAGFRVMSQRGKVLRDTPLAPAVVATIHPSAVLRTPDGAAKEEAYAGLVRDLRIAAEVLQGAVPQGAVRN